MNGRRFVRDDGNAVVILAIGLLPVLIIATGLMMDYGAGLEARSFASHAAASAARAGAAEVMVVPGVGGQVDQSVAATVASNYLAAVTPPEGVTMTSSVSTAPDGVTVSVTTTFTARFVLIADRTVTRTERAEPQFGQ